MSRLEVLTAKKAEKNNKINVHTNRAKTQRFWFFLIIKHFFNPDNLYYYRSTFCFFAKNLNHKVHKEHKDLINFIFNCYCEPYLFAPRTRLRENRQFANLKVNPMECETIPLRAVSYTHLTLPTKRIV